jgi:hypothetical protein
MGWPARDLLLVYPQQAGWADWPGRLANPWIVGTVFAPDAAKELFVLGYVAALCAAGALAWAASRLSRSPAALVALATLSSAVLPFLLPKMLERYYFLADVLALALAIIWRSRASFVAAIAIQSASVLSLLSYMYWYDRPYATLAGALFAGAGIGAVGMVAKQANRASLDPRSRSHSGDERKAA